MKLKNIELTTPALRAFLEEMQRAAIKGTRDQEEGIPKANPNPTNDAIAWWAIDTILRSLNYGTAGFEPEIQEFIDSIDVLPGDDDTKVVEPPSH